MIRLVAALLALAFALTLVIRDREAVHAQRKPFDGIIPMSREWWSLRLLLAAYVARSISLVIALCAASIAAALRLLSLAGVSS